MRGAGAGDLPSSAPVSCKFPFRQGKKSGQKKSPAFSGRKKRGLLLWQRPTLTGPVVPLPSALESFTSGFGMGPGGSSLLWPPEGVLQLSMKNTL